MHANVEEFIEQYYNQHRLHSALGYQSPVEFEQRNTGVGHGSTQNASCGDLVIPKLEQYGHNVVRILPTNEPEASATRYAEVIAAAIPPDCDDAIVVAHSASGRFLPLVPQRRHVRRLVFLAA